jgi:hypothetical protein
MDQARARGNIIQAIEKVFRRVNNFDSGIIPELTFVGADADNPRRSKTYFFHSPKSGQSQIF